MEKMAAGVIFAITAAGLLFVFLGTPQQKVTCDDGFVPVTSYSILGFPQRWACIPGKTANVR